MKRVFIGVLCLLLLGGCAAEQRVPSKPSLPSRPQEVPVLGLDPCALMPTSVLTELRMVPDARVVKPPPEAPPTARACAWSRSVLERPSASVDIGVVPQSTADYLGQRGAMQSDVSGFPAVQEPNNWMGANISCVVRIDVAPGQALFVSFYNTLGDEPGATHELMCERAHRAAEGVMQQLLATSK